ncbi:hypothetical protein [Spongiactinospora rosea]|uniref:hypothetical protein n=1 Tax=Spongiactinospora rosea TaxID=2248750 RepID=UPI0011C02ED0|nr:hypothetical protein [Spongiactinospora rosea]
MALDIPRRSDSVMEPAHEADAVQVLDQLWAYTYSRRPPHPQAARARQVADQQHHHHLAVASNARVMNGKTGPPAQREALDRPARELRHDGYDLDFPAAPFSYL